MTGTAIAPRCPGDRAMRDRCDPAESRFALLKLGTKTRLAEEWFGRIWRKTESKGSASRTSMRFILERPGRCHHNPAPRLYHAAGFHGCSDTVRAWNKRHAFE